MIGGTNVADVRAPGQAVIYAAKSTQDVHGSIPTQLEDCRALAEREELTVAGEFTDEAFSAFKGNRGPGLAAAQRRAEELAPCALIVQHTDRLSRGDGIQAQHLGEIFFWATRNGVTLRSCQDDLLADPRMGPLMAAVSGMRNHEDSARKSAATAAGKKRRVVERGRPNGRVPYGYRSEGRLNESHLVVDAAQAAIVRRIFESVAAGTSQFALARVLNAEGVATSRSGRWAQGTVRGILCNPAYIGKVAYKGEILDGEHEPLIETELFEKVQRLLGSSATTRGRRSVGTHLFRRGMLRCGECGSAMVPRSARRKNGALHTTYACIGRRDRGVGFCSRSDVRRDVVDSAVFAYFEQVGLDVDATRAHFALALDAKLVEIAALRAQAEREAMQKASQRQRVEADYLAGEIGGRSWEALSGRLDDEIAALEHQAEQLAAQERQTRDESRLSDASDALIDYLTEIRQAVVGQLRAAEGLDAVRVALSSLFESFTLHSSRTPIAAMLGADSDARVDAALAAYRGASLAEVERIAGPVSAVEPIDAGGLMLVPRVRREVLSELDGLTPILRKTPLGQRANNYLMNRVMAYLFAPIPAEPRGLERVA